MTAPGTPRSAERRLTGMVICKNEAARIGDCLASLSFCDEIVVIDSGSTDGTQDIVRATGATLIERPFVSWNDQKDFGRRNSTGPWVLNIDADEVVTEELRVEIEAAIVDASDQVGAFRMPFRNHFRDAWVRTCGYYPDRHVRLVHRERARWDLEAVHDAILVTGETRTLRGHVDHYSFESFDDFLSKSAMYASAFAPHALARGRRSGPVSMLVRPAFRFFRAYILQGGFRQGGLGVMIAGLQAYEVFQKYARLWELQRFGRRDEDV